MTVAVLVILNLNINTSLNDSNGSKLGIFEAFSPEDLSWKPGLLLRLMSKVVRMIYC